MSKLSTPGQEDVEVFDSELFKTKLNDNVNPLPLYQQAIKQAQQVLDSRYLAHENITGLVLGRARYSDQLLIYAWQQVHWDDSNALALVAVGGYGRGELHPHSDIDLLVLTAKENDKKNRTNISKFFTFLWDIHLEPGNSVRSVKQCKQEAIKDITVATALMESRLLVGPELLYEKMKAATESKKVWPIKAFFKAKRDEQIARHERYYDIDYALEPNIKTSPGGLRDIQTVAWIAKRHYGVNSFEELVERDFLNASENAQLIEGQELLWKFRYGLHMSYGRREDRLLFDKQRELAKLFGHEDDDKSLAVEKLMQEYYRIVATLRELNDVLLQHFDEAILREGEKEKITAINKRFQIRNDYIEVTAKNVFKRAPFALMELFVLMANDESIKGVRASTIRLVREHRGLIDDEFRKDIRNTSLFMEFLRSPYQVALNLRRMARYGLLGRYLPEFGRIIGKMQHDLFHIYTVDAHTLQVVQNMRRFRLPAAEKDFPIAFHIVRKLPKIELLYIAGLYHDIAKGRGGDHSELGIIDAENFCHRHHLSSWDSKLVGWLIKKHLLMSMTAQRKDISDPEVIDEFAREMGDKLHLDYLYALTVADINATNPTLWNGWRASLLRHLYLNTKRALRRGMENPLNAAERINDKQDTARTKLLEKGLSEKQIVAIWDNENDEYFIRESSSNIVWQTEAIARHKQTDDALVLIKDTVDHSSERASLIFIYAKNRDYLFANSAAAFEKLNLNIQDARIFTLTSNYCINTYTVLERDGSPVSSDPARIKEITATLCEHLREPSLYSKQKRKPASRKLKYFSKHVEADIINHDSKPYSILEVNCPDQPGILASLGAIFADNNIQLQNARIVTLGERVEDSFFITGADNLPIRSTDKISKLTADIVKALGG